LPLRPADQTDRKWRRGLRPGFVWNTYKCRCGSTTRRQVKARARLTAEQMRRGEELREEFRRRDEAHPEIAAAVRQAA
jgi:hypothetical protein